MSVTIGNYSVNDVYNPSGTTLADFVGRYRHPTSGHLYVGFMRKLTSTGAIDVLWRKSSDGGDTWTDAYTEVLPSDAYAGRSAWRPQATVCFLDPQDGTTVRLLRRVNNEDYAQSGRVATAYVESAVHPADPVSGQPLPTASYSAWGSQPAGAGLGTTTVAQWSRANLLSDGAILLTGQDFNQSPPRQGVNNMLPLLRVSTDGGRTFTNALTGAQPIGTTNGWNEWDAVELANGDLLVLIRTGFSTYYAQTILVKTGTHQWAYAPHKESGLNGAGVRVSGAPTHPELLRVVVPGLDRVFAFQPKRQVGVHGFYYTDDRGTTWKPLKDLAGFSALATDLTDSLPYYANSIAVPITDGYRVHVFGHDGYDDEYGERDHRVRQFRFTITNPQADTTPPAAPGVLPQTGTVFQTSVSVSATAEAGATIRYTRGATTPPDPTTSSSVYTGPLTVTSDETLSFKAWDAAGNGSTVTTVTYDYQPSSTRSAAEAINDVRAKINEARVNLNDFGAFVDEAQDIINYKETHWPFLAPRPSRTRTTPGRRPTRARSRSRRSRPERRSCGTRSWRAPSRRPRPSHPRRRARAPSSRPVGSR